MATKMGGAGAKLGPRPVPKIATAAHDYMYIVRTQSDCCHRRRSKTSWSCIVVVVI